MKKYKNILFDLDGTIVNSFLGISNGINYALSKHSMEKLDNSVLKNFIGPPLDLSFKKYLSIDDKKIEELITAYRDYYSKTGIYEASLYTSIDSVIKSLSEKDYNIFLATAKPRDFAIRVVEHYKIDKYFTDFFTASNDNEGGQKISHKKDVLKYAISYGKIDSSVSIMIGDRIDDILSAYELEMDSIACEYGFGLSKEFEYASYIVSKPLDILSIL